MHGQRRWALLILLFLAANLAQAQMPVLDQRLEEEKAKLRNSLRTEQSLLRQIYAMEQVTYQSEKKLRQAGAELAANRQAIEQDKATIERLESGMPIQSARLGRRLSALYRMGRGGFWKVLLSSNSFIDFVRRYRVLKKIVEMDAEELAVHRTEILALRKRRTDLLRRQAELNALQEREKAVALEVEVEKQKKIFLLREVEQDKTLAERLARDLAGQDAKVGEYVASLPQTPVINPPERPLRLDFARRKGYLPSPVAGTIVGRFGYRVNDRFGTRTRSNGIDIAAPAGTPVRVVADGMVSYIGEFLGYGQVVIVDHGDRFHTLYAQLGSFNALRGEAVNEGKVIGTVGSTGLYLSPVLHFEIRYKGAAVDPLTWLTPGVK